MSDERPHTQVVCDETRPDGRSRVLAVIMPDATPAEATKALRTAQLARERAQALSDQLQLGRS